MSGPTLFARITKVDEEKRLVIGRAVEEVVDKADEVFDYATSKPYFERWSKSFFDATDGKSYGNIRAMHGKVAAGKVAEPLVFNDAEKAIDIAAKIVDDTEFGKVLEGIYTGFSIGGSYVGDRKAEKIGDKEVKRYTADPAEISLVDSPCVPTARFFEVRKKDGSTAQIAFKASETDEDDGEDEGDDKKKKKKDEEDGEEADKSIEVRGTDKQVAEFADLLNRAGFTLAYAIDVVGAESMLDTIETIEKREFSADERKKAAKEGHALPDGSFPINSVQDLKNAIHAYGRAKDKAKAKAHIIARAKSLGQSDLIPENWREKTDKVADADEALIKTALSKPLIESDSDEAFSQNVASEVKAGKPQDQAVAIAYAVQRKARSKKSATGKFSKGLWNVSRFAEVLESLADICRSSEYDLQAEGDESPVPMKLRNELEDLIECFKEMADEESAEMLEQLKSHAGVGEDDEIEEAMEAAMRVGTLRKRLRDPELSIVELAKMAEEQLTADERKPLKKAEDVVNAILAKAKLSMAHADKVQAIHDHASDMGAQCHEPEGEKAAASGSLTKLSGTIEALTKEVEALKKQPMPHIVTLKTMTKQEANGTADPETMKERLLRLPIGKLVTLPNGTIDWAASERLNPPTP